MFNKKFYSDKKVLVTGHTGFKGAWMSQVLLEAGANVVGYALEPLTDPSLFHILGLEGSMNSVNGDIRDIDKLKKLFSDEKPDIVFHLAAQPIVRESYKNPRHTYEINVMGTVNVLECVRNSDSVCSVVNVTTDKVYKNREWQWGYRENEELNGFDPYSNSKSCSELVTSCYVNSYFRAKGISVSTARAGNVIGGGDFANDRIIPDCIRSVIQNKDIIVRNPYSTRPYQHVLEPVCAYLMIAEKQFWDMSCSGNYNVGPDESDCYQTGVLVDMFVKKWGQNLRWINQCVGGPHEANFLKLDCSLIKETFGWHPCWNLEDAIDKTIEWVKCWNGKGDVKNCMIKQINEYVDKAGKN